MTASILQPSAPAHAEEWARVLTFHKADHPSEVSPEATDSQKFVFQRLHAVLNGADVAKEAVAQGAEGIASWCTPVIADLALWNEHPRSRGHPMADLVFKLHVAALIPNKTALLGLVESPACKLAFSEFWARYGQTNLVEHDVKLRATDMVEADKCFRRTRYKGGFKIKEAYANRPKWPVHYHIAHVMLRCVQWMHECPEFPHREILRNDVRKEERFAYAALGFYLYRFTGSHGDRNLADYSSFERAAARQLYDLGPSYPEWSAVHDFHFEEPNLGTDGGVSQKNLAPIDEYGNNNGLVPVLWICDVFTPSDDASLWFREWFGLLYTGDSMFPIWNR